MSTTNAPDRFSTLPDDQTLPALPSHSKNTDSAVEVVDDLEAARAAVLALFQEARPS